MNNQPFDVILNTPDYHLRYSGYGGQNKVSVATEIENTFNTFGNNVTQFQFNAMIDKITRSARSSVVAHRQDPNIIRYMCIYFPQCINSKVVSDLIKCVSYAYYPDFIKCIMDTGYIFTNDNIQKLCIAGYDTFETLQKVSYGDFVFAYFTSISERCRKFYENIDNPSEAVVKTKINELKTVIDKYKIIIEDDFLNHMLVNIPDHYKYVATIRNLHIIAKNLGSVFHKDQFYKTFDKIKTCHEITGLRCYSALRQQHDDNVGEYIKPIVNMYDNVDIDRNFILDNINISKVFKSFLVPDISSYDPTVDIIYILLKIYEYFCDNVIKSDTIADYINHMIDNKYLCYDPFLLFLVSIGFDSTTSSILNKIIEKVPDIFTDFSRRIIDNFYKFGRSSALLILSDNKFIPNIDMIKKCTTIDNLECLLNETIFLDPDTKSYIKKTIFNQRYAKQNGQQNGQQSGQHNGLNNKKINLEITDEQYYNVYNSMNDRDKEIVLHANMSNILEVSFIFRYNITITREHLKLLVLYGKFKNILLLLHLTSSYNNVINHIDEEIAILSESYMERQWILNNIIQKRNKNKNKNKGIKFHIDVYDNFIKKRMLCWEHLDEDVKNILEKPKIDIEAIKNRIFVNNHMVQKMAIDKHFLRVNVHNAHNLHNNNIINMEKEQNKYGDDNEDDDNEDDKDDKDDKGFYF